MIPTPEQIADVRRQARGVARAERDVEAISRSVAALSDASSSPTPAGPTNPLHRALDHGDWRRIHHEAIRHLLAAGAVALSALLLRLRGVG